MKLLTAALLTLKFTNNVSVKNRLSVNDLFVYESGVQNEQTILFLHGSGANSNMWLQHISELSKNLMMKMMASGLGVPEEEFPAFEEGIKMVSPKSFRRAMSQANQLKTELENFNFTIPILFVSGETESVTMHNSHHYLANQLPESKCAWYPEKGHAWMVADVKTHIQLTKYWFLNDTFPEQLVMEELTEGKK